MKKKILFVIESLNFGGAEKSLVTLLNKVDLSNYEVEVWLNVMGGEMEQFLPKAITVRRIPRRKPTLLERFRFFVLKRLPSSSTYNSSQLIWKAFNKTYQKVPAFFDIAIAYHQGLPTYYVVEKINAGRKIGWMNTDYQFAGYSTVFDLPVFKSLDKIIAVSDYARKTLADSFVDYDFTDKTEVLEDYIDREMIIKLATEKNMIDDFEGLKIVTVGRLNVTKGYPLAVEAARLLKEEKLNFRWYFIGDGTERRTLEQMIHDYDLEEKVMLLGAQANPYTFIRAADIYVQTSVFEGFSISVREAKVLNKPIVCTNFPSIKGALYHRKNGLVVEMNGASIAESIMELYEHPQLRTEFAEQLKVERLTIQDFYTQRIKSILEY